MFNNPRIDTSTERDKIKYRLFSMLIFKYMFFLTSYYFKTSWQHRVLFLKRILFIWPAKYRPITVELGFVSLQMYKYTDKLLHVYYFEKLTQIMLRFFSMVNKLPTVGQARTLKFRRSKTVSVTHCVIKYNTNIETWFKL